MHERWKKSFGVLANGDPSTPLPGHKFPVVIGEVGSFLVKNKVCPRQCWLHHGMMVQTAAVNWTLGLLGCCVRSVMP